mmetsp:Transcript_28135/g.66826  ORF Transcript_28135/g.66826 Transcript_28135/m.66826 type:complete len:297 (-) Transcript_28135:1477-2367(-)
MLEQRALVRGLGAAGRLPSAELSLPRCLCSCRALSSASAAAVAMSISPARRVGSEAGERGGVLSVQLLMVPRHPGWNSAQSDLARGSPSQRSGIVGAWDAGLQGAELWRPSSCLRLRSWNSLNLSISSASSPRTESSVLIDASSMARLCLSDARSLDFLASLFRSFLILAACSAMSTCSDSKRLVASFRSLRVCSCRHLSIASSFESFAECSSEDFKFSSMTAIFPLRPFTSTETEESSLSTLSARASASAVRALSASTSELTTLRCSRRLATFSHTSLAASSALSACLSSCVLSS